MIDYIASNYSLWFVSDITTSLYGAPYNISDCNTGVVGIATACCDYTIWIYNCEEGCIPAFAGAGWPTPGDCWTANPQWAGYGTTPCGWLCDPVCEPCFPVFQLGLGYPYNAAGLLDCEMNCSCVTDCYICDCTATTTGVNVNCDLYTDPITGLAGCPHWPPNEGIPVNPGDPLTYLYQSDCLAECTCEGGIDCFISSIDGHQLGGCSSYPSLWHMDQQNATWSLGSPTDPNGNPTGYTTTEECCLATECCWAVCEEDPAVYDPGYFGITPSVDPALQGGGGGTYPCWWWSQSVPDVYTDMGAQPSNCCSPLYVDSLGAATGLAGCIIDHPNAPYCDMIDCINSLCPDQYSTTGMTCCVPPVESCICACDTWITQNSSSLILNSTGPWAFSSLYDEGDTVSYGDGNTPPCCWICTCPFDPLGQVFGSGVYDCNSSPPDDGPYGGPFGPPNCWVSCERLPATFPSPPSNILGAPCGPCSDAPGLTFSCNTYGCQVATCDYAPGGFNSSIWQTQNNCYTSSTCDTLAFPGMNQCRADCYCADPNPVAEITSCTVLQDYLNDIYAPGSTNWVAGIGWYSAYAMTYPPVQPGLTFNTSGSYWWPFATLFGCITLMSAGMDCCDTSGFTYDCDDSCNCPTVNGNPCVGGTGCFQVLSGPPGSFTSLAACQAWCTWECDPTGPQICIFNAASTAPTTYGSALACSVANTNCECVNGTVEYWCDWAGADAGDYNTFGAQPCRDSAFMSTQVPAYQAMAIGQGMLGPTDPNNNYHWAVTQGNNPIGQGFPSLAACQQMCRFCCDCAPPGSGICDLCGDPTVSICNWGDQYCSGGTVCSFGPSELSPYLCQQNTIPYPCVTPITEYCCDPVLGCQSFTGTMPVGCVSGPYANLGLCQTVCNFVCGDCIPTGGQCYCTFVNAVTSCLSPYPFPNMLDCQTYLTTINLTDDAGSCCKCYGCFLNTPINYMAYDTTSSSWISMSTPVNPIISSAIPWVAGTQYNTGDVVTEFADGDDCCYVMVWGVNETTGIATNWTIPPSFYYTAYVNDITLTNQVWPGGGTGSLAWIPCDPGCPNVQVTTYDCVPGVITDDCEYDQWGNLRQLIVPPTVLLSGEDVLELLSNPLGMPNLQSVNVSSIKMPYGGWVVGFPTTPCLYNGFPLAYPGSQITLYTQMNVVYGIPLLYPTWASMIAALITVPIYDSGGSVVSLNNTYSEVCEAIALSLGWGVLAKCIEIGMDPCSCTQTQCYCTTISGPGGQFTNILDCQALLTNVPCCGTWFCPGGSNCECIFQPNVLTGFPTQIDCYNAINCCEVQEPEYACVVTTVSPGPGIPDICDCIQTPGGFYTGVNALLNCQNDPTTCCSGTPIPDMWKCNTDCNCVIDPAGPHATLHDCQIYVANNCCYTGGTWLYECVLFDDGSCNCVQTATGTHPTLHDCLIQVNTCCYTGGTRWDCKDPGGGINCTCVQSTFGFYSSQFNCENSIPVTNPHPNCCENISGDCMGCEGTTIIHTAGKHYGPLGGLSIFMTNTTTLTPIVDRGLWVSGTNNYVYLDVVEDPLDGCCYALVQTTNHSGTNMLGAGSPLLIHPPSVVYTNHINGYYADGSFNPASTPVAFMQEHYSPWWPCDPNCVGAIIGYDCYNCPGTCVCNPNYTSSAQFQGPGALAACQAVCIQGCDDCAVTLAGVLTGPVSFEGPWNSVFGPYNVYDINDCVVDGDCCFCCVEDPIIVSPCTPTTPPGMCPMGQVWVPFPVCGCQTPNFAVEKGPCTQNVSCAPGFVWQGTPVCACVPDGPGGSLNINGCGSQFQPTINVGASVGVSGSIPVTWAECYVDPNGNPCNVIPGVDCENCDTYMSTQWGATLPLAWKANPLSYQHFDIGDCVEDPNDGCCYCCMESFGDPAVFGPNWVPDNGLGYCAIYDMAPADGIWEYYGSTQGFHFHGWVSCTPTGSFPCGPGGSGPGSSGPNKKVTATRYDCKSKPLLGDANNMACVESQNGNYPDLKTCQNSPCPPINKTICEKCCQDNNWQHNSTSVGSLARLQQNANPCDCEFWLGIGWSAVPLSKCSVVDGCVEVQDCTLPYVWAGKPICGCILEDGPAGNFVDGCIQDESCANGWMWSWDLCKCVTQTKENCMEKECPPGKFWDNEVCKCIPHKTIPTKR